MKDAATGAGAPQGGQINSENRDSAGRLRSTAPISEATAPAGGTVPGAVPATNAGDATSAADIASDSVAADAVASVVAATPAAAADSSDRRRQANQKDKPRWSTKKKVIVAIVILLVLAGLAAAAIFIFLPKTTTSNNDYTSPEAEKYYSVLTGEEILSEALNSSPTYCVQIPNGTDISPRTQIGLQYAGVVFEAIAESGITRFAAIFQNADTSMIGPIRSLRTYYLEWDTPFDCTIVHAGGSDDALAALAAGGYRDLTESTTYMWRNTSNYYSPNNLFTSSALLTEFNTANGFTNSSVQGFTRMTPDEAATEAATNQRLATEGETITTTNAAGETETTTVTTPLVSDIRFIFGNNDDYNVVYTYNAETNSYDRSYANGNAHSSYDCGTSETTPSNCVREQLSPSVVIAMIVQESRASDGYHEDITTLGTGTAYIFQNGTVIEATWRKDSAADQITFYDQDGEEVALGVGQTWISAVPSYGSVEY